MKHGTAWVVGVCGLLFSLQSVAGAASFIGIRPGYAACLDATEGPDLDWIGCSRNEFGFQDVRLNAAYRTLLSKLLVEQRSELRASERAWISARDGVCANSKEDGQGKPLTANDCAVVFTARRASALEVALTSGNIDRLIATDDPSWRGEYGAFAPPGGSVYAYQPGFLSDSSTPGAVLVTTASSDSKSDRSVELFVPDGEGRLRKAVSNSRLVPCAGCGGLHGDDPLAYVWLAQGRLLVVTSGGGRERWSNTYAFKYSDPAKTWILSSALFGEKDTVTGQEKRRLLTSRDFGVVRFEDADPAQLSKFSKV